MKCKEAKIKLHFWIDNQLHNDEAQKLLTHLSLCKSCTQLKNDLLVYKGLINAQEEIIPYNLDPIAENSEHEKNRRKVFEMVSLAVAACFGILIGMSLFQISHFNADKKESIIAETQTNVQQPEYKIQNQNTQNVNVIKKTYYQPMSFMVYYDDFFFTDENNEAQECSFSSE
jgi:hypothetical protein